MKKIFVLIIIFALAHSSVTAQEEVDSTNIVIPQKKRPWLAAGEVIFINWAINRFNKWTRGEEGAFACVTWESWKDNIKTGFVWDWNSFGTNFFAHPYHGSTYFNSARSLGLTYWESAPYAFAGSMMWEFLGETHPASPSDLANTTLGGIFIGESLHRFSELILDDRATGGRRTIKEITALLVNPVKGFNRMFTGEMWKKRPMINHIRSPLEGHLAIGGNFLVQRLNSREEKNGPFIEFSMVYGDAFAKEKPKPMDFFSWRSWIRFQKNDTSSSPFLNIYSFGVVAGKRLRNTETTKHLFGLFQHFDYLNSPVIEIGDMAYTGGLLSNYKLGAKTALVTNIQLGVIVMGGSNSELIDVEAESDDPSDSRDYIIGPGLLTKADIWLRHNNRLEFLTRYGHWNIFVASGPSGRETLDMIDLRAHVRLFRSYWFGVEGIFYFRDAHYDDFDDIYKELYEFRSQLSWRF